MFGQMLQKDRERWGLSIGQVAWRFGVSRSTYLEIEDGTRWPSFETYERICDSFGWPRAYVGSSGQTVYR